LWAHGHFINVPTLVTQHGSCMKGLGHNPTSSANSWSYIINAHPLHFTSLDLALPCPYSPLPALPCGVVPWNPLRHKMAGCTHVVTPTILSNMCYHHVLTPTALHITQIDQLSPLQPPSSPPVRTSCPEIHPGTKWQAAHMPCIPQSCQACPNIMF